MRTMSETLRTQVLIAGGGQLPNGLVIRIARARCVHDEHPAYAVRFITATVNPTAKIGMGA